MGSVSAIEHMHRFGLLSRSFMDPRPLNNNGSDLINLCKATGLLISNGRVGDDKGTGRYTRVDGNGSGVVDYVLGTPSIFMMVNNFEIHDKFRESDHSPRLFSLRLGTGKVDRNQVNTGQWSIHGKYAWSTHDLEII